ncbi:HAD family hydrolase [Nitrospina sp. 32_T5]|uniref:HAD family hydrolase n=1 Tax=unclassified Nitrospina TaxID=2638683 RepID=UPI003F983B0C
MRYPELVIFDLDDTLIDTSDVYWRARNNFIEILAKEGFDRKEILAKFESIDGENIKVLGHIPQRYGKSMQDTYLALKNNPGMDSFRNIEMDVKKCGNYIFNHLPELIDGALELIKWTAKHYTLALLTRGDVNFQKQKLKNVGLLEYFQHIQVVGTKNETAFRDLICETGFEARHSWIIGDSIKSDINPGIKLGMKCILYVYEHANYRWNQEYGEIAEGPFFCIDQLTQAKDILENPSAYEMVTAIPGASSS